MILYLQFFRAYTVKLGIKELLNKEQTGFKEHFYVPTLSYHKSTVKKGTLAIYEMAKLGISEHKIVKISKRRGF